MPRVLKKGSSAQALSPLRISIRGIGAVFPGGVGKDALVGVLRDGASLIGPSRRDPRVLAAELDENLKPLVPRRGLAALSRSALLAAAAIEDLLRSSVPGSTEPPPPLVDCGLVVGTAFGHVESKADYNREARRDGVRLVSPILFPNTIINSLGGHAAILFNLTGPNSTVTSGRRSGLEAILRAGTLLRAGRATRVITVGCDEVSATLLRALRSTGQSALSIIDPARRGEHGGVAPGEAAVALLLGAEPESPEAPGAPRSNPEPRAEAMGFVLGTGESNAVGKSLRDAIVEAMQAALRDSGSSPSDVGWLATSRGGIAEHDLPEESAASEVFGPKKPCLALKATFGETFGAAGVLGVAAAVLAGSNSSLVDAKGPWGSLLGSGGGLGSPLSDRVLVCDVDSTGATCVVVSAA
jgi:3-oxoacyl-[acyl-carrier-protein] synthase II